MAGMHGCSLRVTTASCMPGHSITSLVPCPDSAGTPARPELTSAQGGISQLSLSWSAVDTAEK